MFDVRGRFGGASLFVLVACSASADSRTSTGTEASSSPAAVPSASVAELPPDAGAPDSGAPDGDDLRSETYQFPESHPCIRLRPEGHAPDPARTVKAALPSTDVKRALEESKRGRVTRVTIAAHGIFGAGCACLPFALADDVDDIHHLEVVYLPGVKSKASRERLDFTLVGYFTGRIIDLHEYYRSQNLPATWASRDEDSPDPDQTFPEFCLEAWCHSIPVTLPSRDDYRFLMDVSLEHQASMLERGAPKCAEPR